MDKIIILLLVIILIRLTARVRKEGFAKVFPRNQIVIGIATLLLIIVIVLIVVMMV